MCGISGLFGHGWTPRQLHAMVAAQYYRGPDDQGTYFDPSGKAALGHNRLSIIDLSSAGAQPMYSADGRLCIVFNGEIYNYIELRSELRDYPFRTRSDTEVILAAYMRWGPTCVDHFIGMFAFLIWDGSKSELFAARDRFGIKPLYYAHRPGDSLAIASEIVAFKAAGIPLLPNVPIWSTYLAHGLQDHTAATFWSGIETLPPGHTLKWREGRLDITCWYDLAERVGTEWDSRPLSIIEEEYTALLEDAVRLRFRSDVPVGINLSGGVDSSTLLGLVHLAPGNPSDVEAFTFTTGDVRYDELPWVRQMVAHTNHPVTVCQLDSVDVPELAGRIQRHQLEPFGGLPTLAYAQLFKRARQQGTYVLLDGQGMDEQWAGYDYYTTDHEIPTGLSLQGCHDRPTRPDCLMSEFSEQGAAFDSPKPFPDHLRNMQYRDIRFTKMPRALRFNDRVSMLASVELRAPFLDHRLFELALRQPPERTIGRARERKALLRRVARRIAPAQLVEAPKRPLQTPQREWLRGDLRDWTAANIENAFARTNGWFDENAVRRVWQSFTREEIDNSFFVWQWISVSQVFDAIREEVTSLDSHGLSVRPNSNSLRAHSTRPFSEELVS
jgi:asparagine synthase (glutamine-hydrolysing)